MVQNAGDGMMTVTSNIMNDYNKRHELINQIVEACVKYNLDGVNLDFENMKEEDKDLYSRFIIELTPRLKDMGMVVSVDVTAPDGAPTWSLCFDRHVIGDVADYIIFMAYDQYGASSNQSGTTAGYNWVSLSLNKFLQTEEIDSNKIISEIIEKAHKKYDEKEQDFGEKALRELERVVMLKIVDERWMDHIDAMDELKDGIGLRAYGQKDPVVQYRIEGFDMFDQMVADIQLNVVKILMNARKREGTLIRQESVKITGEGFEGENVSLKGNTPNQEKNHTPIVNTEPKVGRNDPCPCGSGKKYKNCCGKNQ